MYPHLSVVSPGYVLTSEDVKLGTVDEKEHAMFVLLGPGSLTQYNNSSSNHLPADVMIFSLQLERIPVCMCTMFSLLMFSSWEEH